jgi:xylulokinase
MSEPVILAHDVGTSGTKSSVVGADGAVLASESTPHGTVFPAPGLAEQDPRDWWEGVCRNTRALAEADPGVAGRIAGIGVSGHMLGCVALDSEGAPLRPAMIHSDCRATRQFEEVEGRVGGERVYETSGNILDPRSPLCKMLWLKASEPEIYARTARFVQSKDFIVGRMTGRMETTDYSDASHAQWLDIRRRAYAEDVLGELGLDASKLPALHASTDRVGELSAAGASALGLKAGIPVVAGGGDGACASAGAGAVREGDTYCCLGTTAWISATTASPYIDAGRRIFNILALDGTLNGVYGTVQSAGRSVDWAMELLGERDFARFDALLESVPAGSDRLVFLPYLEGERSPIFDAAARGVFFGLTPRHGRAHLLRATLEGVTFALRSVLAVMQEAFEVRGLRLIGGGGQSAVWPQMLADICGVAMERLSTRSADATSLGAAMAAGVGVGLFADMREAARAVGVTGRTEPDASARETYDALFEVYMALYPRLKDVFPLLAR